MADDALFNSNEISFSMMAEIVQKRIICNVVEILLFSPPKCPISPKAMLSTIIMAKNGI